MNDTTPPKRGRPRNGDALAHDLRACQVRLRAASYGIRNLTWYLQAHREVSAVLARDASSYFSWWMHNYSVMSASLDAQLSAVQAARKDGRG